MTVKSWFWTAEQTWSTEAPPYKNWIPASALSMPPVANIGNPGKCLAISVTALKAIGLIAFPLTPPYVVNFLAPTEGQAVVSKLIQ